MVDTDKVWLITGSSTGFGHALAEAALNRGYRVVATARQSEQLQEQGSGHILNLSSFGGIVSGAGRSLYSSTKFALKGLVLCQANFEGLKGVWGRCPSPVKVLNPS